MDSVLSSSEKNGFIASFGDFNADKKQDIFVIDSSARRVSLLRQSDSSDSFVSMLLINEEATSPLITSVMPADFDGDNQMDLLLTRQSTIDKPVTIQIFWGHHSFVAKNFTELAGTIKDQPLLFDYNGDMLPDILGESTNGEPIVWLSGSKKNFTQLFFPNSTKSFSQLRANTFTDLNEDFAADLLLDTTVGYEEWLNTDGTFIFNRTVDFPDDNFSVIGQSTILDMNRDGEPEQLVPVCVDKECADSRIYCRHLNDNKWYKLVDSFENDNIKWRFTPPDRSTKLFIPLLMRFADVNLDGFPDVIVVLRAEINGKTVSRLFPLLNEDCQQNKCSKVGRTLSVLWSTNLNAVDNALYATFFDVFDNGISDILLVAGTMDKPTISVYKNYFHNDASFIKVMTVSGLCYNNCPDKREPYGVNQPGVSVEYSTTSSIRDTTVSSRDTQLSQTAHFSLQLPYITFGLGLTPNFVDKMTVGIPNSNSGKVRKNTWTALIPNSQLVVIPYPINSPSWWIHKMFVTPSRMVLITGGALLATCLFIAVLVGLLHWREKREDKKEKRQDAHKFHFDAM